MSLGDHLEELRARLVLAILGLLIGTGISLCFGRYIIHLIEKPYLDLFKSDTVKKQIDGKEKEIIQSVLVSVRDKLINDPNILKIEPEIEEYIYRFSKEAIIAIIDEPNINIVGPPQDKIIVAPRLQTLAPADGFISYIKIALIAGLILSSPWVFYQLWMFVAAGLYQHERKYIQTAVPFSAGLFIIGAIFFLRVIAPLTLEFLVGFNQKWLGAISNFTFAYYISFVTTLMLVFGIAFQTPIAIFLLTKTGLASIQTLCKYRKFVILIIFIIAAMATPPDPVSQVSLAIPLYALFELGILLSWLAERRKKSSNAIK